MKRIVKIALIQTRNEIKPSCIEENLTVSKIKKEINEIKKAALEKNIELSLKAIKKGANIICFQELAFGPYFCAETHPRWYFASESLNGKIVKTFSNLAKENDVVFIVPFMEKAIEGVYYNSSAVIDADGKVLGVYRKSHIPDLSGFFEKFYFKPGNTGFCVFESAYARLGVLICYDRHFMEGWRSYMVNGAEIVFNPSSTTEDVSKYLWNLEQPAAAFSNMYFVAAVNRVGVEKPWEIGKFFGESYVCGPDGKIIESAGDKEEVLVVEIDLAKVEEERYKRRWIKDRNVLSYSELVELLP